MEEVVNNFMVDNYLHTFSDFFFDIKEDPAISRTLEDSSSLLDALITKYGELENELRYGTSSQDYFVDTIICTFIRKIMEQLDAINALFSIASFSQAEIILRSLIENIVSLEFILNDNIAKRAASYFLEHHYEELELGAQYFNPNTEENKLIHAVETDETFSKIQEKCNRKKASFERLIASNAVFQAVDQKRKEKLIKNKKKSYIHWYEICSNASNFRELMEAVGLQKEYYRGIYGGLSFEAHAQNSAMALTFSDEDKFQLTKIRTPFGAANVLSLTSSFSLSGLMKIYEYLHDGKDEKDEFRSFYAAYHSKEDSILKLLDMIDG